MKPILEDPVIFRFREPADNPLIKVWEALVQVAAKIFENPPEDQVATQIPLSGDLEDPDADVLATLTNLLRNAFVAAISHSVENSISLRDGVQPTPEDSGTAP